MNSLAERFGDELAVIGFPTNQFGGETNESEHEILNTLAHVRPGGGYKPRFTMMGKVEVNGKLRKRLCVEDMVQLVTSLNIPARTTVFLEEGGVEYGFSAQTAFVQGYNFGLWKGVLAAAGLTVEVVKPQAWKHALGLARSGSSKDDSRHFAAAMFSCVKDDRHF